MSVFHNNALIGAGAGGAVADAFQISRSLRFSKGDSAYLSRTPSSAGNRRTWSWSGWVKRANSDSDHHLFVGDKASSESLSNSTFGRFYIASNGKLYFAGYTKNYRITSALLRDFAAWYHLVLVVDTTQSTADDRVKIYINGSQVTQFDTKNNPSQNDSLGFNTATPHTIGARSRSGTIAHHHDGYLAEVNFLDGIAVSDATDFGEYDSNNVWRPKEFTGSYNGAQVGSGIVYSSGVSSPDGTIAASPNDATALFDGGTSTNCQTTTAGTTVRWTPPTTTTWSSSLRINTGAYSGSVVVRSGGTNYTLNSNGTQVASPYWLSHPNSSGTIEYIEAQGHIGAGVGYMKAIEIDGTILQDGTPAGVNGFHLDFSDSSSTASLGYDAAGSNTWTVNNLQVAGSAWNQSQTWSNGLSALSGSLTNPPNGFDGDVDSYADSTAGFSLDLSSHTFGTGSHSIEVKSGGATSFSVNGSTSLSDPGGGGAKVWTGTHTGEINSIASSATGASVYYIKIDNLFLVNAGVVDTAASGIDSLIDTPTNYTAASGNNGGNYAIFNPLNHNTHSAYYTLSNGNLKCVAVGGSSQSSGSRGFCVSTLGMSSGKYYFELTVDLDDNNDHAVGIATAAGTGYYSTAGNWTYAASGNKFANSGSSASYGASYGNGDTIGVAFDADTGALVFYKNGTSQGTLATVTVGETYFFVWGTDAGTAQDYEVTANFGQRPFAYTPPTGYVSLCTQNLPDPTIADGSTAFDTVLYTGNGSTQSITGLGFSPDFVWLKGRNVAYHHRLFDVIRGQSSLSSDRTNAEGTSGNSSLTSFDTNGFSITQTSDESYNQSTKTYIGWTWDAGANSSKTYTVTVVSDSGNKYRFDGHGTSAVTLNLEEGSTYVFDQSDSSNSGHPLRFSTTSDGTHGSGSEYTTGVTSTGTPGSAGAKTTIVVASGAPVLHYYCSAHSGMGGQVNTNSTAGATVLSGSLNSSVYNTSDRWSDDVTGATYGGADMPISRMFNGNLTQNVIANSGTSMTFSPSGFSSISSLRIYGSTYTGNANGITVNGTDYTSLFPSGGGSAAQWVTIPVTSLTSVVWSTTGSGLENGNLFGIEVDGKLLVDDNQTPPSVPAISSVNRANASAGFSIVTWSAATNTVNRIAHNLNATPGFIITKSRTNSNNWRIWHSATGKDKYLGFDNAGASSYSNYWSTSEPDSSTFGVWNASGGANNDGDMLALVWAPVEGYSAFGSYTGNGSATNPPFIFTGMRPKWLLIKATTGSKSWYLYDTARSEFNVTEHALKPDNNDAEGGTSNKLDILSNGFKWRNSGTSTNVSGVEYIYAAFAEHPMSLNGGLAR